MMKSVLFSHNAWLFLVLVATVVVSPRSFVTADDGDDDTQYVTCGSAIKLSHVESQSSLAGAGKKGSHHFLNSEGKNLGSGSGQQIVTTVANPTTTNTLWWIRGPHDDMNSRYIETSSSSSGGTTTNMSACRTADGDRDSVAERIQCGQVIRMTHLESMRNLHSHEVKSPLSRQQEVSAFGQGDGQGDSGDDWKVICSGRNTQYWELGKTVAFQHVDSGKFLGASSTVAFTHQNCGHNCPILHHLEVFGRSQQDNYGLWVVEMGIHLSK